MTEPGGILVLTREPATADAITSALSEKSGHDDDRVREVLGICRDLPGLHAQLEGQPGAVSLVVVDVDPEPDRMLGDLEPVINRYQQTRFVLVSREVRQEWLLQAMQAGARHYMIKDRMPEELAGVVDRILPTSNGHARRPQGALITVAGTAGGCGATTIAVNLANELRLSDSSGGSAIILDLDNCYGSAAAHLGLEGSYGLSEVLQHGRSIDAELIRTTAVRYGDDDGGVDVLMNPTANNPCEPTRLDFTQLPRLLSVCRQNFRWVIADAPRLPIDVLSTLAQSSLATLVVFQMNVNDLRIAKSTISGLLRYGISSDSIVPVANRHRKRYGMLSLQDVQRTLNHQRIGAISNDFSSAQTAVNYGQPLAECAPRSTLRRDIRSLASSLVEARAKNSHVREW